MVKQTETGSYIERIQVEGGFLDGLDLALTRGLNVVIGARGTGKSSLIELIRYGLNIDGYSNESAQQSLLHATNVLEDGQVCVTVKSDGESIEFSRSADGEPIPTIKNFILPQVFSQKEIETVGLSSSGRLRLIDEFLQDKDKLQHNETKFISAIKSLTVEIANIQKDIAEYEEKLDRLPDIEKQLLELAPKEKEIAKISKEAEAKTKKIEEITQNSSSIVVAADYVKRFEDAFIEWSEDLAAHIDSMPLIEKWSIKSMENPLGGFSGELGAITQNLKTTDAAVKEILTKFAVISGNIVRKRNQFESESRQLRTEVEALQKGAGEITRQGQKLKQERIQLGALKDILDEKRKKREKLIKDREKQFDELEKIRDARSKLRDAVVGNLNKKLEPRIRFEILHASQLDGYITAISEALRGSNIKYKELVPFIAENISPRELVEITDSNKVDSLTSVLSITEERASRIINSLKDASLGELSTVLLEDEIIFQLLDGGDYKNFSDLSTGQKCTVVLPLILEHEDRILIIDQPEDHIDNAFIADTLIKAIQNRSGSSQIILTTHNANIPVLGNAERVVHLCSDGSRGFVEIAEKLFNKKIVTAISNVMEGGQKAFQTRAEFYKKL